MAANHGIPRPEPNRDTPEPNRDTPEPNRDTLLSQSRHWSSARVELRERLSLATALGRAKGSSTWALGVYREQHFGRTSARTRVLHRLKIGVTGGASFMGSPLCRRLVG